MMFGERGPFAGARHLTRSEPEPLTVPAMTLSPSFFVHRHRFAGDHRFIHVALAARARSPSAGTLAPGRTSTTSPSRERRDRHVFDRLADDALRRAGQQLRQLAQRACACEIERISIQ